MIAIAEGANLVVFVTGGGRTLKLVFLPKLVWIHAVFV